MAKPTVHDIAKEAGVSLATVDRVLNARPGVREKTVERVQSAVKRLGYVRDTYAANLARQRMYRFGFVLPAVPSQFQKSLGEAISEASKGLRVDRSEIRIERVPPNDPVAMVRTLETLMRAGIDGVAIMANETPAARDMISRLKAAGIAVVTLVTDQPNSDRDHFVGIDNIAAGRTAGVLMGRFAGGRTGKVIVVVNSIQARDMVQRRYGFDEVLARDFPNLQALPSIESHDDHELTARLTEACLMSHDDIVGIYCVGAGTRGVTQVMTEHRLAGRVICVGHELTANAAEALREGLIDVVITQNVGHLVRSAIRMLRAKCDGVGVIASQERIRIEIVLRENLP